MKPEEKVRKACRELLEDLGWGVWITHGNKYQSGFPDAFLSHMAFGKRWVDFKVEGNYSFTKAQKQMWPDWHFNHGIGIWILTGVDGYDKLFNEPNWLDYWKPSWGDPEEIAAGFKMDSVIAVLNENWRPLRGFKGYEVSDTGKVLSVKTNRLLEVSNGYVHINGKKVPVIPDV